MPSTTAPSHCRRLVRLALILLVLPAFASGPQRTCHGQQRVARNESAVPSQPPAPEHPLAAPLRWAQQSAWQIDNQIQDYTCTMFMRKGAGEPEQILLKVRHRPFSLYMYYLEPAKIRGREVLFVEDERDGKFLAHEGRGFKSLVGSVKLQVSDKYPLHNLGIKYLNQRLIQLATEEMQLGKCQVLFYPDVKVGEQEAFCVQVAHPERHRDARMPLARAFFDRQTGIPFRYEGYRWPQQPGAPPVLDEEYTYLNLKLNVGLTDRDFDSRNPDYSF